MRAGWGIPVGFFTLCCEIIFCIGSGCARVISTLGDFTE